MTSDTSTAPQALPSDEERELLRAAVRGVLADVWPAAQYEQAVDDPERLRDAWHVLCQQGFGSLGSDREEGGLREIAIVMEELGRAACLAPMLPASVINLVLAPLTIADPQLAGFIEGVPTGASVVALGMDLDEGSATDQDGTVSGVLELVEAADIATHVLVPLPATRSFAVVDATASGVLVEPQRAMGAKGLSRITLDQAPAALLALSEDDWTRVLNLSRVALAARAYGEAVRPFEMVVDYVKQRHQFGRPVGAFQAIQHKLANCLIALNGCSLLVAYAAESFDLDLPTWQVTAAAAFASAAGSLPQVTLETHHAFGAIAYAEEHEAPRHTKRVYVDMLRLGGRRAARADLATHYLDGDGTMPEFDLGQDGNAFRDEVEAWLDENWTPEFRAASDEYHRRTGHDNYPEFARKVGETGWLGLSWPKRFGGQARGPLEELAFLQAMERHDAPNRVGSPIASAMLIAHGTPEQQQTYLPEILAGALHGICYSEPDSGSDLASLRTKAVRDGDGWVINGQKIWTTTYYGDYVLVAARTDPDATPKHAGLSVFMVATDTPGITVQRMDTMYDGGFANVFFDDVRVPGIALLGAENNGWKVLMSALATERGVIAGGIIVLKLVRLLERACEVLRERQTRSGDALVRDTVGALAADIEVARQLMIRCARLADNGVMPLHEAAMAKVFAGELHERFGEAVLDSLGPQATVSAGSPGAIDDGRFELQLRTSLMWVISMGTNEIQRNLIAQRGLGLPR
jgi:alkylation response protein AidB-like acyl-CoA dehydrogenase